MPVRIDHAPGQPAHTTAALDASGSNGRANDWGVEPPGIVAFAGKGGVGKSTLLVSTAVYLIARGWAVVVVDLDQTNQSIEQWRLIRERMRANELADVKLVTVPVVAQVPRNLPRPRSIGPRNTWRSFAPMRVRGLWVACR